MAFLSKNDFLKKTFKKIFFYRICGAGMGAAACLLRDHGYEVEGADKLFYPPMSDYLKNSKILTYKLEEVTPEFLEKFDLIVVGNVVAKNSPEAQLLESLTTPLASFPTTLGALVLNQYEHVVGLAGTHGKTTTTYLMTQVFEALGEKPGYFIGGVLDDRPPACKGERVFFIEADEYDSAYFEKVSKFRQYGLTDCVVTSLEFDHADIFSDLEDIKDEFRALLPEVSGSLIFSEDYPALKELQQELKLDPLFYGESSENGPEILESSDKGTQFRFQTKTYQTNLTGLHNILNLCTVIAFAKNQGFNTEQIQPTLTNLKLVKRRQEVKGVYHQALIIDDFAHHPKAVKMTLEGLKQRYPGQKIMIFFEPRSATARSSLFQQEFVTALQGADQVVLIQYQVATTLKDNSGLDLQQLQQDLENTKNIPTQVVQNLSELKQALIQMAQEKSVIAFFSNGDCLGLWASDVVQELSDPNKF